MARLTAAVLCLIVSVVLGQDNGCPDVLTGSQVMLHGFDAYLGKARLLPVFQLSYTNGQTWSPPGYPECQLPVPDEMEAAYIDENVEHIVQIFSQSYDYYMDATTKQFSFNVGLRIGSFSGGFKYNHEQAVVKSHLETHQQYEGWTQKYWSFYQLTCYPPFMLTMDPVFKQALSMLPATIQTQADAQMYQEVVTAWGTDYPTYGTFGGSLHADSFANQTFVQNYTQEATQTQMGLWFHFEFFNISAGGFTNRTQIWSKLDKQFLANAETDAFYRGGDAALANNVTYDEWVGTISRYADYLNLTFNAISDLITDNPTKKQTFINFVNAYVKNGAMGDWPEGVLESLYEAAPVLPGQTTLGSGADAVTGALGMLPLFDFSYALAQTWSPPPTLGNSSLVFPVPDQIVAQTWTESYVTNTTIVTQDVWDYQRVIATSRQWNSGFLGLDSHSVETYDYLNRQFEKEQILSYFDMDMAWLQLTMPVLPPPPKAAKFLQALRDLPTTFNDNNAYMFQEFFTAFGTAYVDSVLMGATMNVNLWSYVCLLNTTSVQWMSEQAGWSLFGLIGDGHGHTSYNKNESENYAKNTESYAAFYGGNLNLARDASDWMTWVDSVDVFNMVPIDYTLRPISELALPEFPELQPVLEAALKAYLAEAQASSLAYAKSLAAKHPVKPCGGK